GGAALASLATGRARAAALAAAGVAIAHALGLALGLAHQEPDGPRVRVAVVQGNIDQGVKWSEEWRARTLQTYEDQSREAARHGAELIVWAEAAVPGLLEADGATLVRLAALARETHAWLVVGSVGSEWDGGRPSAFYDSAFVFDSEGKLRDRYDKTHLVPFGEYVPLRGLIGFF